MASNHQCMPGGRFPLHPDWRSRRLLAGLAILASFALAPSTSAGEPLPGRFDQYALPLSWSPTYCQTKAGMNDSQHCGPSSANVFVLHGLRPQDRQGALEDCALRDKRVPGELADSMLDIMPSKKLITDEWKAYGSCSGLGMRAYFDLTRTLFSKVRIPSRYQAPKKMVVTTPKQFVTEFVKANPDLTPDMISLTCGDSRDTARLAELRVCFGKDGNFQACEANERRQCRAKQLVLPLVVQSTPAFTTKYVYYKVSGDSAAGVYVSMLKRGPHVGGAKAYAATSHGSSLVRSF